MAYNPSNPNGATSSVNSAPVVVATDQAAFPIYLQDGATGGSSVYSLVTGASNHPTSIKASSGKVTGWYIYNSNGSARKVAFHDTAGTPTPGTGVYFSVVVPALSAANCPFPAGIGFTSGIGITTVVGLTASDATAVAANDLVISIFYK